MLAWCLLCRAQQRTPAPQPAALATLGSDWPVRCCAASGIVHPDTSSAETPTHNPLGNVEPTASQRTTTQEDAHHILAVIPAQQPPDRTVRLNWLFIQ